jgi:predicted RecB family endonuclease
MAKEATFAVIAEHPPDLCPTSNSRTRQILKEGAAQVPQLAEQLGVEIVTLRVFGPDHILLAVVEADDIGSVRDFALQSRLMQWNTVKIHATYSMEEALALVDEVETIF